MDGKLFLVTVFLSVFAVGLARSNTWLSESDIMDSFKQSMKAMEEAMHGVDLAAAETQTQSREDLEEDDKNTGDPDQPPAGEKKPEPEDEDEDDDEDDDDAISSVFQSFPNIFNILKSPAAKPWWDGPNVCVEREVKESGKENETEALGSHFFIFGTAQFSSCKHSPNKYACTTITSENGKTKTSTVTYQCCHGFRRAPSKPGCSKMETKPMLEMLEEAGCSQFAGMVRSAGLQDMFTAGNLTLFAPTDEAVAAYQDSLADSNQIEGSRAEMGNEVSEADKSHAGGRPLVLSHVVPSLIQTDDFTNDKVVKTSNNLTLRINVFPGRRHASVTVNCARLNSSDKVSTEGVLHTLNRVITPASKTVLQLLDQPQYSLFKKLLEESELLSKLEGDGPYTVLAVKNEDIEKSQVSKMCIQGVLEHHILPHTVCAEAAAQGRISALDMVANWLRLEKTDDGLLFDNTVPSTKTDVQATNGVIHEVADFVVPQSAKGMSELLKGTNHTKFLALVERAGLTAQLDRMEGGTVFVPSERGLTSHEDRLMAMSDADLKQLLQYHMLPSRLPSARLANNLHLTTLLPGKQLSVSLANNMLSGLAGVSTRAMVQCTPLTRIDGEVCNGLVHEVAEPVAPPTASLLDLVAQQEDLSRLREVIKDTSLEQELKADTLGDLTLLAPTDEAFDKMGEGNLSILLKDKDLADQILRNHVLRGSVCCSGVGVSSWPFLSSEKSVSGSNIETNRSYRTDKVTFAGVPTAACDLVATNGVLHKLSAVILPAGHRRNTDIIFRKPNSEIILTGF